MASTAHVVIGAGFGDEGKGLMTDYLSDESTLVVRFNGGAQAGHTVVTPEGRRHVFHHVGSGTFRGAATLLSRHFICNPLLLRKELAELEGVRPDIRVDARAAVTTPWDMAINQLVERKRGDRAHGSCGVGINETVTRHALHPLKVLDILSVDTALKDIQENWVPARLAALDISRFDAEQAGLGDMLFSSEGTIAFAEICRDFLHRVTIAIDDDEVATAHRVVFEGAQGLLLDEHCTRFFPHVTRSRTGLPNVMALARTAELTHLDVVYVTRAYATRHGAGPFPQHVPALSYPDDTNQPHQWQGTMRFGVLDTAMLASAIEEDRKTPGIAHTASIVVTHLDQMEGTNTIMKSVTEATGLPIQYGSWGPTRDDIGWWPSPC